MVCLVTWMECYENLEKRYSLEDSRNFFSTQPEIHEKYLEYRSERESLLGALRNEYHRMARNISVIDAEILKFQFIPDHLHLRRSAAMRSWVEIGEILKKFRILH